MSVILFLIILLVLVLVHEFGHFFSAKRFDIKVEEFGFGFPPKLFGKKYGETEYTFNLLPLGGFVKIFGENPEETETAAGEDLSRSFVHQARWKQAIVLFAGVFSNFLLAWVLFSFGFMSGLPTSVGSVPERYQLSNVGLTVVSVEKNSPADMAGLKSGDVILGIYKEDGTYVSLLNSDSLKSLVVESGGQELQFEFERGAAAGAQNSSVIPALNKQGEYEIGISMDLIGTAKLPFFAAFWEGLHLTLFMTKTTAVGLFTLIKEGILGRGSLEYIAGPVGIVSIVGRAYEFGLIYLLSFTALISVNLAIINLIPFPALDGGRLLFLLIEKIKGSRIKPRIANTLNMIGFSVLIILMLIITYNDIINLL